MISTAAQVLGTLAALAGKGVYYPNGYTAAAVQAALDQAEAAGGGTVILPPGTYAFERTVLVPSNCNLIGSGRATVLTSNFPVRVVDPLIVGNKHATTATGYGAAGNIVMGNFAIDSKANGVGCAHAQNVRFFNIWGIAAHWHYFDISGSKDVVIDGFWLTDTPVHANSLLQVDNLISSGGWKVYDGMTEVNANVDGTVTDGITIMNGTIDPVSTRDTVYGIHFHRTGGRNVLIENVRIRGCHTAIFQDNFTDWTNVVIRGCQFLNNRYRAVFLQGRSGNCRGLEISDCIIEEVGYQGIALDFWRDVVVANVTVKSAFPYADTSPAGISFWANVDAICQNAVIEGNGGASHFGIRVRNTCRRVAIDQVILKNLNTGIEVSSTSHVVIGRVVFDNVNTRYSGYGSGAPTGGTWDAGDIVWSAAPTAGGKVGWICVAGGTPGTWKQFGMIDP